MADGRTRLGRAMKAMAIAKHAMDQRWKQQDEISEIRRREHMKREAEMLDRLSREYLH